jgi:hypothetical protein
VELTDDLLFIRPVQVELTTFPSAGDPSPVGVVRASDRTIRYENPLAKQGSLR